jgi:hypothetical protein
MAFPNPGAEFTALGITASNIASAFLRFYGEKFAFPNFLVDNVKALPWPGFTTSLVTKLEALARDQVARRRRAYQNHEPFHDFTAPTLLFPNPDPRALAFDWSSILGPELDEEVAGAYGFTRDELAFLTRDLREAIVAAANSKGVEEADAADEGEENESDDDLVLNETETSRNEALISYCVGVAFGRWDVRMVLDHTIVPQLAGPFDPLPSCPPGALVTSNGLPASNSNIVSKEWLRARKSAICLPKPGTIHPEVIEDDEYPIGINWDGIIVDDPEHADDIVRRVRGVLELISNGQADSAERKACEKLGVKELREYFRKPNRGGFWNDHVARYSKSRRKAPIYWLLQSSKKNYALWLYYHRLDKDLLFKALVNYVEPKIQRETNRLDDMRRQRQAAAGGAGKGAKKLGKDIERQEDLISELRDFEDKLRRVANLHLEPDLNDGVVLNIAPLHELVPWKEAKNYWDELLEGEYAWSSIGKRLQQKGFVK